MRTSSGKPSTVPPACLRASTTCQKPMPPPGNFTTTSWKASPGPPTQCRRDGLPAVPSTCYGGPRGGPERPLGGVGETSETWGERGCPWFPPLPDRAPPRAHSRGRGRGQPAVRRGARRRCLAQALRSPVDDPLPWFELAGRRFLSVAGKQDLADRGSGRQRLAGEVCEHRDRPDPVRPAILG